MLSHQLEEAVPVECGIYYALTDVESFQKVAAKDAEFSDTFPGTCLYVEACGEELI